MTDAFSTHILASNDVFWKPLFKPNSWFRVILKKVSFGIFRIILVFKEEKKFTVESKDKGLSLRKFSR